MIKGSRVAARCQLGQELSLLFVELSQHVDLLKDFNLEKLDDLGSHFWTLLSISNTTRVVVNWKVLINVSGNHFRCIALQSWNSNVIKNWVLKTFLCRGAEEWIVLEHFANQLNHLWRTSVELLLHAFIETGRLVRLYLVLIVHDVDVRNE